MVELAQWDSFYLIVGGAAGALIGLQFVVMTLIASSPARPAPEAGAAFGTPTIVHFGGALFLSATLRAPWQSIKPVAALLSFVGLLGVVYAVTVIRRMRAQNAYEPVFEDWLFHALLPVVTYGLLGFSSMMAFWYSHTALFGVGLSVLLLLFIGIHNSWDAVTYHVMSKKDETEESDESESG